MPVINNKPKSRIDAALEKLFSLHRFGMKLGLENMQDLCMRIGNPERNLKMIHVAGSNGKGSTASFMSSILIEAGFKVGLYTSPHFVKFNERIRINGKMIDDEYVADFFERQEKFIEEKKITFFEVTTAMAFRYFSDYQVDYAIIETGLGGRLDATNVISPLASVITSISLEHTEHLGDTIEKIAFEKGGIIKPGIPVFTGIIPHDADKVFREINNKMNGKYFAAPEFAVRDGERVKTFLNKKVFSLYSTPLRGIHQLFNAALAVKTLDETVGTIGPLAISKGIENVVCNSGIEGRYEVISEKPRIIFDSAHNPEGICTFTEEFSNEFNLYEERILIFGVMKDKSVEEMLLLLKPYFTRFYLTSVGMERAAGTDYLMETARRCGIEAGILNEPAGMIREFSKEGANSCLVILGSMYLLGEIKTKMLDERA